jgi:Domain of unknown function (DUF5753)/Helix-turn-helix domain
MSANRPVSGPTVLRMILGRQLQELREKAGLSYDQAADAIYSSAWTVRRMERAEGGLKPLTVKGLLLAYGITDPGEIDAFLALARQASKPGWWHSYDDVLPPWFRIAIGLEESADLIRAYEPQVIPGLLQTGGYARAITRGPRNCTCAAPDQGRHTASGWKRLPVSTWRPRGCGPVPSMPPPMPCGQCFPCPSRRESWTCRSN